MTRTQIILENIFVFLCIAFASFLSCSLAIVSLSPMSQKEPITVNIVIPNLEDYAKSVAPEETEPAAEHQPIDRDFDIFEPCGYTVDQLEYGLSDSCRSALLPYADTFLEAEDRYGVNAFYLMCKFGLESGWGQYESGENNIGGWMASDGTYMDFTSVEDCIMHIAKSLSTTYRESVGSRLEDVCVRYCPDETYLTTLLSIMEERQAAIESI